MQGSGLSETLPCSSICALRLLTAASDGDIDAGVFKTDARIIPEFHPDAACHPMGNSVENGMRQIE
jgi:hypothetical protein